MVQMSTMEPPTAPASTGIGRREPARIAAALDSMGSLPVLRGTIRRVMDLADDPEGTVAQLVDAIEADEAFAANMLAFANAAGNARPISARTVRQAVTLIGRRATRQLALEAATYGFLERAPGNGRQSRGQMHLHAVAVGQAAANIAQQVDLPADTPHLAGLLHDIGKLVLPMAVGEAVIDGIAAEHPFGVARAAAERRETGVDHALAGGLLARRWGCAEEVVEAIAWHHDLPSADAPSARNAACVNLADLLATISGGHVVETEDAAPALELLGMSETDFEQLVEKALTGDGERSSEIAGDVAQLERLAQTDDLTGLANRRHWLQVTRETLGTGRRGSMLLCDVDAFKQVNDRLGHRTGDLVLTEVARILSNHGRAGRLGGDEFVLWLDGDPEAAHGVAQTILIEAYGALSRATGDPPFATLSIGVVECTGDVGLTDLLDAADDALYRAKAEGGNAAVIGVGE